MRRIFLLLGVLVVSAVVLLIVRRRSLGRPVVVLGEQLARAARVEEARKRLGKGGPSPLAGRSYDATRGELSLSDPAPSPLDAEIRALLEPLLEASAGARDAFGESLSMDDQYTLLAFAGRAAVFAMRDRGLPWARLGVTSLAVLDPARLDPRDILVATGYLHHAAGTGADQLFHEVAARGGQSASLIADFAARKPADKDLKAAWLADEVETPNGRGFIGWGGNPYQPSRDLKPLVLEMAALLAADEYPGASPSVAAELPDVWLGGGPEAKRLVAQLKAVGHVAAQMRAQPESLQILMIWLAEAPGPEVARALADRARKANGPPHARLVVGEGNLVCLLVARSMMGDAATVETNERVARFSEGLTRILRAL